MAITRIEGMHMSKIFVSSYEENGKTQYAIYDGRFDGKLFTDDFKQEKMLLLLLPWKRLRSMPRAITGSLLQLMPRRPRMNTVSRSGSLMRISFSLNVLLLR